MPLTAGTRLDSYEILGLIGTGGMGEVYRAHDSKLKRDVAIKVLPPEFAGDAQRMARFQREAQVLASLNHPHIGAIYDFENVEGRQFLVLELVEGETLADRIAHGPIPFDEALSIAAQVAEALEAAHERGIVHRDLKPANIKLSQNESVKVLDFGLAKTVETRHQSPILSNSPTMTSTSVPGMILGTVAYMSPEQAKGQELDRTTDVWAFGCVLYEMLVRTPVFEGSTVAEVLGGVMKSEPDWKRLPTETPLPVRRLLRRCLQKDRKQRLQCLGDARLEITDVLNHSAMDMVETAGMPRRERIAWITLAFSALLIAVVASVWALRGRSPLPEMRVDIATPASTDLTSLAVSPDGLKIVFVAGSSSSSLWLRSLESSAARALEGTENAAFPFWSPDSRSIGFFAGGKLKRIDVGNGLVTTLTDASGRGGTWNGDGVILFAPGANTPLFRISAAGGQPVAVTRLKGQQGTQRQPHFLPDGHHFLFWAQDGGVETRAVYAGDLGGSEPRRIVDSEVSAVYSPSGQLLFFRDGRLFAQPFDVERLTLKGTPSLVADQVLWTGGLNIAAVSASAAGPVAYRTAAPAERQLIWLDRTGKEIQRIGAADRAGPLGVSLSPDSRRVAFEREVNGNVDVWFVETVRGVLSRFTSDPSRQRWPVWSPDGSRVAYGSNPKGTYDIYEQSANGDGTEKPLLVTSHSKAVTDWSADGRFLLYESQDPKTGYDLWALDLNDPQKQFLLVQSEVADLNAQLSPDGKWLAYDSNASGRFEVYVQPFPGPGRKTQISDKGGAQVRWRRDGRGLFYIGLDERLTEVSLQLSRNEQIDPGSPVPLFTTHVGGAAQSTNHQQYAVSPDGNRFLMNVVTQDTSASPITVILNWRP